MAKEYALAAAAHELIAQLSDPLPPLATLLRLLESGELTVWGFGYHQDTQTSATRRFDLRGSAGQVMLTLSGDVL